MTIQAPCPIDSMSNELPFFLLPLLNGKASAFLQGVRVEMALTKSRESWMSCTIRNFFVIALTPKGRLGPSNSSLTAFRTSSIRVSYLIQFMLKCHNLRSKLLMQPTYTGGSPFQLNEKSCFFDYLSSVNFLVELADLNHFFTDCQPCLIIWRETKMTRKLCMCDMWLAVCH